MNYDCTTSYFFLSYSRKEVMNNFRFTSKLNVPFRNKTFNKFLTFVKLYGLKRDFNHDFKEFDIFFYLHHILTNVKQYSRASLKFGYLRRRGNAIIVT